jgi:hypothetical protein
VTNVSWSLETMAQLLTQLFLKKSQLLHMFNAQSLCKMHSDCAKIIFENIQVKILFKGDYYGGRLPSGVLVIFWKRVKIQMS